MNWERWFCPNQHCSVGFWMVQPSPDHRELWQIANRFGGAFTVAAVDPVCLRCGAPLGMTVTIAQRPGGEALETGPLSAFVRSLR